MPSYKLNRDYILRSTSGVITFVKGEPTFVPSYMEREVVMLGGECLDGDKADPLGNEEKLAPIPQGEERYEQMVVAFELLVERNDSSDFTGSGAPSVKAVERIIGFDVARDEVVKAWTQYRATKAEAE